MTQDRAPQHNTSSIIREARQHHTVSLLLKMSVGVFMLIGVISPLMLSVQAIPPKQSKDYGVRGHTFPIWERSLLVVINERLLAAEKSGKIKELQAKFTDRVKHKVAHPLPVQGMRHTTEDRTFIFDPTLIQRGDIKDHKGRVVVKDGTMVNPLDHVSWGEPLVFIDGDEETHVRWSFTRQGKIILVKGAPLDLQDHHKRWFYFDQAGILTRKFGITHVPAIVSQEGKYLKVEERRISP